MPSIIPPVPPGSPIGSYQWADWYEKVRRAINNAGNIKYSQITDFTGSNLVNLQTRSHQDLQNILGPTGARGHVPTGGTTGQVLAKVSATDYDYAWAAGGGSGSGSVVCRFVQTANATVANTTTATSIIGSGAGSMTLTTADMAVASAIRVFVKGVYSAAAIPGNLTLTVKLGSAVLATYTVTNVLAGATNQPFEGDFIATIRTTGATGTAAGDGGVLYATTAGFYGIAPLNNGTSTVTVDTTASRLLDVTVQWATASASNSITSVVGVMELMSASGSSIGGTGTVTNSATLTADQVVVGNGGASIKSLPATTNGYVLTLVGGIPTYAAPSGGGITALTGDVTASGAGSVVATFGSIADQRIIARIAGSAGAPSAQSLSAILDAILGSTQGQLITRNATTWTVLGPSTGGKVLQENGPAANLSWATPAGGAAAFVQGRLTLTTGVPVTATDVIGAATIYFTPYKGNLITLWSGSAWSTVAFIETSLAVSAPAAGIVFDRFAYLNAGSLALEDLAWKNATVTVVSPGSPAVVTWAGHGMVNGDPVAFSTTGALPSGITAGTVYQVASAATNTFQLITQGGVVVNVTGTQSGVQTCWSGRYRGTPITYQDGRLCKSGDKTRLYLGTFCTTATTTTEDSGGGFSSSVGGKRFLYNHYNQEPRQGSVIATGNWTTPGAASWRQVNATVGNRVEYIFGLPTNILAEASIYSNVSTSANLGVGIGVDSITTNIGRSTGHYGISGNNVAGRSSYIGLVSEGYRALNWLEWGGQTNFGTAAGTPIQSGMQVLASI